MNKTQLNIGYKRVSTPDQNTDRQLVGIDLSLIYEDKVSGKSTERPKLKELLSDQSLSKLHNVTLYIHSLDRLARNLQDLLKLIEAFNAKNWAVCFVKEGWIFNTGDTDPVKKLMLQMMGSFAEFERNLIKERQREGIALAKAKGVYKGRTHSLNAQQVNQLKIRAASGATKAQLSSEFGISRSSVYNYLS